LNSPWWKRGEVWWVVWFKEEQRSRDVYDVLFFLLTGNRNNRLRNGVMVCVRFFVVGEISWKQCMYIRISNKTRIIILVESKYLSKPWIVVERRKEKSVTFWAIQETHVKLLERRNPEWWWYIFFLICHVNEPYWWTILYYVSVVYSRQKQARRQWTLDFLLFFW
jgi:hypothetical protein